MRTVVLAMVAALVGCGAGDGMPTVDTDTAPAADASDAGPPLPPCGQLKVADLTGMAGIGSQIMTGDCTGVAGVSKVSSIMIVMGKDTRFTSGQIEIAWQDPANGSCMVEFHETVPWGGSCALVLEGSIYLP